MNLAFLKTTVEQKMSLNQNYLDFSRSADDIIQEIKDKLANLNKMIEEPEFDYKRHCDYIREQVDIVTNSALKRIEDSRTKIMGDVNEYELQCNAIAQDQLRKKMYLMEIIEKSHKKIDQWKHCANDLDEQEKEINNNIVNDLK